MSSGVTSGKVARRYARALFELTPPDNLDSLRTMMDSLAKLVTTNRELKRTLSNPAIKISERIAAIVEVARLLSPGQTANPELAKFLSRLMENGRFSAIGPIAKTFAALVDRFRKIRAIEITSAFNLDDNEKRSTEERIRKDFGGGATVDWKIDAGLIGGLQVKAGDLLLDGSVRTRLEQLRAALVR